MSMINVQERHMLSTSLGEGPDTTMAFGLIPKETTTIGEIVAMEGAQEESGTEPILDAITVGAGEYTGMSEVVMAAITVGIVEIGKTVEADPVVKIIEDGSSKNAFAAAAMLKGSNGKTSRNAYEEIAKLKSAEISADQDRDCHLIFNLDYLLA